MLIYGKIFGSMYEGSMAGAGSDVFAVMGYVVSHMQPEKMTRVEYVGLNPKILAAAIGASEQDMEAAIKFLCSPDKKTTTPGDGGARLVVEEPFVYRVVNGQQYRELKDEQDRREKAAERQAKHRSKKREGMVARGSGPLSGEMLNERSVNAGNGEVTMSEHMEDGTG